MEYKSHKGFTLVELLISIGIIGLVTGIVLVKYSAFDSTILLKNSAYEIALALREAQTKSVSVSYLGSTADYPFGVTFRPTRKDYTLFRFGHATNFPTFDSALTTSISTTTIGRTMKIKQVCIIYPTDMTWTDCRLGATDRLDVSFRRPEYKALIRTSWHAATDIQGARIKVDSSNDGTNVFVVEVSSLGQISVFKE